MENGELKIGECTSLIQVGQKQITMDYLDKLIEIASKDLHVDFFTKSNIQTIILFQKNQQKTKYSMNSLFQTHS